MELENLNQFDEALFNKYFGTYIKEQRLKLGCSYDELSDKIFTMDPQSIELIESGNRFITKHEFDSLCTSLELDPQVLINIGRLTQVRSLIDVYMETNEHYPKQTPEIPPA